MWHGATHNQIKGFTDWDREYVGKKIPVRAKTYEVFTTSACGHNPKHETYGRCVRESDARKSSSRIHLYYQQAWLNLGCRNCGRPTQNAYSSASVENRAVMVVTCPHCLFCIAAYPEPENYTCPSCARRNFSRKRAGSGRTCRSCGYDWETR